MPGHLRSQLQALLILDLAVGRELVTSDVASEVLAAWWRQPPLERGDLAESLVLRADLPVGEMLPLVDDVDEALESSVASVTRVGDAAWGREADSSALPSMVAGRYASLTPLGSGGMGDVYRAFDTALARWVALKFLRVDPQPGTESAGVADLLDQTPELDSLSHPGPPEGAVRRFQREARITGALEHPGVPPVHEVGLASNGVPYYAMRLLPGDQTLADEILPPDSGRLDERLTQLETLLRVCDTVEFAHSRHILHLDLKPRNIGLGGHGEVLVLDWGLACGPHGEDPLLTVGSASDAGTPRSRRTPGSGTPGYMAPEVAFAEPGAPDSRADVFGLGVILFEILTGRLPFPAGSLDEYREALRAGDRPSAMDLNPEVPEELARICEVCLRVNPDLRYATIAELTHDLRRWATHRALERALTPDPAHASRRRFRFTTRRSRRTVEEERRSARMPVLIWAGVLLLVLLAAAVVVILEVMPVRSQTPDQTRSCLPPTPPCALDVHRTESGQISPLSRSRIP